MRGKCSQPKLPPPSAPLGGLSLSAAGAPWALAETRLSVDWGRDAGGMEKGKMLKCGPLKGVEVR